jgi:hypothetical protein
MGWTQQPLDLTPVFPTVEVGRDFSVGIEDEDRSNQQRDSQSRRRLRVNGSMHRPQIDLGGNSGCHRFIASVAVSPFLNHRDRKPILSTLTAHPEPTHCARLPSANVADANTAVVNDGDQ